MKFRERGGEDNKIITGTFKKMEEKEMEKKMRIEVKNKRRWRCEKE